MDSSIHMNTLALALARGGVWPQDVVDSDAEAQKGLYFRQFLPASAEVTAQRMLWNIYAVNAV